MKQIVGWKDIPYSEQAEKALAELKKGEVLAVRAKHVKNGKIQIEFAQRIDAPTATNNLLGAFNASDNRFSNRGPRRTWLTAEPVDAKKLLGLELSDDVAHADILNVVSSINGFIPALQITEKLESELTDSQAMAKENYLKQAGAGGNFFYAEGSNERVCQFVDLVGLNPGQEVNHTYIKGAFKSATNVIGSAVTTAQGAMSDANSPVRF